MEAPFNVARRVPFQRGIACTVIHDQAARTAALVFTALTSSFKIHYLTTSLPDSVRFLMRCLPPGGSARELVER